MTQSCLACFQRTQDIEERQWVERGRFCTVCQDIKHCATATTVLKILLLHWALFLLNHGNYDHESFCLSFWKVNKYFEQENVFAGVNQGLWFLVTRFNSFQNTGFLPLKMRVQVLCKAKYSFWQKFGKGKERKTETRQKERKKERKRGRKKDQ